MLLFVLAVLGCSGSDMGSAKGDSGRSGPVEICDNAADDDGDGDIDCDDVDCVGSCPEDCANGFDDDGDSFADCEDPDCDGSGCYEVCDDSRDNDGDGFTDCEDSDCLGECPEDCGNGEDDDGDGRIDCLDDDCNDACPEDCSNGEDDDFDGDLDCDDAECASTCDQDGDGFVSLALGGDDCDDTDPYVNPDMEEVCGNGDDDCDGRVDEEDPGIDPSALSFFYRDADFDGFGSEIDFVLGCSASGGYVAEGGDCNDNDNGVYPTQIERCNLRDDDCDDLIDDEDDDIDPTTQQLFFEDRDDDGLGGEEVLTCFLVDGFVEYGGDCDDDDPLLLGAADWLMDEDGDGYGAGDPDGPSCEPPGPAWVPAAYGTDCDDGAPYVSPGVGEVCENGIDDDCDTVIDGVIGHDGSCLGCGAAAGLGFGPLVYWRMDVASGIMIDAGAGTAAHGTVAGSPVLYEGLGIDAAWGLDGDDYVSKGSWDDVPRDAFSISLWMRSDGVDQGLLSYASSADTDDLLVAIDPDGQLAISIVGEEGVFPVTVNDGAWHHVVVIWDNDTGNAELFLDGERRGTLDLARDRRLTFAGTLMAGAGQAAIAIPERELVGVLDEIAVYEGMLTVGQIADIYLGTHCGEGAVCNSIDDDEDGVVDEHLVGQTDCPAASCEEIHAAGAWYGPGDYAVGAGEVACD